MSRSWELVIDWLGRPVVSNAYRKMHWTKKRSVTALWRQAGAQAAMLAKVPMLQAADIEAWGVYKTRTVPDPAAIEPSVKAAIDGLVDRGVIGDDTAVWLPEGVRFRPPAAGPVDALVLRITEVES